MGNSLNMDLNGMTVVMKRDAFRPEEKWDDVRERTVRVTGGFGASAVTSGTALLVEYLADGEKERAHGYGVERLATDEEVQEATALRMERIAASPVGRLDALSGADADAAHGAADRILLECVPPEVRDAYQRLVERAPWWATA